MNVSYMWASYLKMSALTRREQHAIAPGQRLQVRRKIRHPAGKAAIRIWRDVQGVYVKKGLAEL
jgi:hypothetical protein